MPLTVDFQQCFVVSFDDVYTEVVAFGAFGMEGASAAFVIAWNRHADHVAANGAARRILLAAVDPMQSFNRPLPQVIIALRMQHETANVDESPLYLSQKQTGYAETQVRVSFRKGWVG